MDDDDNCNKCSDTNHDNNNCKNCQVAGKMFTNEPLLVLQNSLETYYEKLTFEKTNPT